jgi:hypothetical protein
MNQLTTIAALPSAAGQAAHLPAEVGEKPARTFFDEAEAAFHPLPVIDADMLDTSE